MMETFNHAIVNMCPQLDNKYKLNSVQCGVLEGEGNYTLPH